MTLKLIFIHIQSSILSIFVPEAMGWVTSTAVTRRGRGSLSYLPVSVPGLPGSRSGPRLMRSPPTSIPSPAHTTTGLTSPRPLSISVSTSPTIPGVWASAGTLHAGYTSVKCWPGIHPTLAGCCPSIQHNYVAIPGSKGTYNWVQRSGISPDPQTVVYKS